MQCANCNEEFNDGVTCSVCSSHLDFGCAGIMETTWRRYNPEKRSNWKCQSCRAPSPAASTTGTLAPTPATGTSSGPVTLDLIMKELQTVKRQMAGVSSLKDDMRTIKQELSELKDSCAYACDKMDEISARLSNVESRVSSLEKLRDTVSCLQKELDMTKNNLSAHEQRTRLNNIEIKGVPVKKDENLFSVFEKICSKVNHPVPKPQINYISRVPMYNSKEKLIIVSFINRYTKEDYLSVARAEKLTAEDIGFKGASGRLYINDHLSSEQKKLLTLTKSTAQAKNYRFVWVKHGKIHVRRDDSSKVLVIRHENDLNKLA